MIRIFSTTILVVFLLVGSLQAQEDDRLRVVATTTQAADAVRILAGDHVQLTQLMGSGVDPHLYQPTEADVRAMNEAQLVVYSGLHLEGQLEEILESLGESDIRVFALGDIIRDMGFTISGFDLSEELVDVDDPHFWFDPRNWQLSIRELALVLAEMDSDNAAIYEENAEAYIAQLDELYAWGLEAIAQIPEEQRTLVTSHDAFQYFADAFGMEVSAVQGLSTEDEAGVGDVQGVVDFVIENAVLVMFVESSVSPNTIQSVQEAAAAQGWDVRLGERGLYSDAMGEVGTFGGTYIGMLGENIMTIVQSFGYEIPAWPENLEPALPETMNEDDS